jgi:hypothetical protein
LLKLLLVFAKIAIIALVFEKNANFFAENWQKSHKIVIITSTPDELAKNCSQKSSQTHFCQTYLAPWNKVAQQFMPLR